MNKMIAIFNKLIKNKFIDATDFYTVSITEYEISLQGRYSPTKVIKYKFKKFNFNIDENGYFASERNFIKIILTD